MYTHPTVAPVLVAIVFAVTSFTRFATAADAPRPAEGPPAAASPHSALAPSFGLRVGGYSFRSPESRAWDDCQMGGVGLFGQLALTRYAFVELGVDSYQASKNGDRDMDRVSVMPTVAGGLRMFPDFVITPYVQIGTGMEWTRVDFEGRRTQGIFPLGFLGVGSEIHFSKHFKAGANLRFLGMAHPRSEADAAVASSAAPKMEYRPAAQGQFFLRYAL